MEEAKNTATTSSDNRDENKWLKILISIIIMLCLVRELTDATATEIRYIHSNFPAKMARSYTN